ncbi:tetratricopeptide repeat protein [bacterium]|nr:tetratricopeptide repeat protein [bacterium]
MGTAHLLTFLLVLFVILVARIYFLFIVSGFDERKKEQEDTEEAIIASAVKLFKAGKHDAVQKYLKRHIPRYYKSVPLRSILVNSYFKNEKYNMAIAHLAAILEIDPYNYSAKGMLADCYKLNGQVRKAIETYEEILEEEPNELQAVLSLAELFRLLKNKPNSLKYLKMVLDNPKSTNEDIENALVYLARINTELADFEEAIKYLDRLQELYPEDFSIMTQRVNAFAKTKNWAKCLEIYERILIKNPNDLDTYEKIGQMKFNLQNWDEALEFYQKLLETDEIGSKNYILHKNRIAEIYINNGKNEQAIELLTELIKEYPAEDMLAFTLAQAYLGDGDYERAVALYTNLMEDLPQDQLFIVRKHISNLVGNWAEDLFAKGSYNLAFDKFFLALKYDEDNPDIYYKLGACNYYVKSFADAVSHFKRAIALNPEDARSYLALGYVLDELGDLKNADAAFSDVLRIDPLNVKAKTAHAITLAKQYNLETSIEAFQDVLLQIPADPDINYNTALAYEMYGDIENAIKYYKKALKLNVNHIEARHNVSLILGYDIIERGESLDDPDEIAIQQTEEEIPEIIDMQTI